LRTVTAHVWERRHRNVESIVVLRWVLVRRAKALTCDVRVNEARHATSAFCRIGVFHPAPSSGTAGRRARSGDMPRWVGISGRLDGLATARRRSGALAPRESDLAARGECPRRTQGGQVPRCEGATRYRCDKISFGTETAMARVKHTLDRQPGSLPDIRTDVGGITFVMAPPGAPPGRHLHIRCDAEGEVWISIRSESTLQTD
jgi:hypothetical protein